MNNPYETKEMIEQYMEFHYGDRYFNVDNYPVNCAQICLQLMQGQTKTKALDLGCAVGRTTFELARKFSQVVGVDLSQRFIECANHLKDNGSFEYLKCTEGDLATRCTGRLSDLDLDQTRSKVEFRCEDACNLSSQHHDYNLIFAGNLIDRLHDPKQFLSSIHNYLTADGVLVISTPYTLLAEYTPREKWLGGFTENGKNITVLDGMKQTLDPHFTLINEPIDVPFVLRETKRKFQHTIAEMSCWKRTR